MAVTTVRGQFTTVAGGAPTAAHLGVALDTIDVRNQVTGEDVRRALQGVDAGADGSFSLDLPATTAPNQSPNGSRYRFTETVTIGIDTRTRTYSALVPADVPGGVVELRSLAPAMDPALGYSLDPVVDTLSAQIVGAVPHDLPAPSVRQAISAVGRNMVNVAMFTGWDPSGGSNSSAAVRNALTAAGAGGGLYLPASFARFFLGVVAADSGSRIFSDGFDDRSAGFHFGPWDPAFPILQVDGSSGNFVKGIRIEDMSLGPGVDGALPSRLLDLLGACNQIQIARVATLGPASISHFSARSDGSHNGPDTVNVIGCNFNPGGLNAVPAVVDLQGTAYGPGDLTFIGGQISGPAASGHALRLHGAGLIGVGVTVQTFGDRHGVLCERDLGGPLPVLRGVGTLEAGGGTDAITMETWDTNPDPAAVIVGAWAAGGKLALSDGSFVTLQGRGGFWADNALHTYPRVLGAMRFSPGTGAGSSEPAVDAAHEIAVSGDANGDLVLGAPTTVKAVPLSGILQSQGVDPNFEAILQLVYGAATFPLGVFPRIQLKITSNGDAHVIPHAGADVRLDGLNAWLPGIYRATAANTTDGQPDQVPSLYVDGDGFGWLLSPNTFKMVSRVGHYQVQGLPGDFETVTLSLVNGNAGAGFPRIDLAVQSDGILRLAEGTIGETRLDPSLGLRFMGSTTALPAASSALRGQVYLLLSGVGGVADKFYLCIYDGAAYNWKLFTLT